MLTTCDKSAGYIASGFWAGLALGRLILPALNVRVGERKIAPFYLMTCLALEFAVWFARSLIGNAITVVRSSLCSSCKSTEGLRRGRYKAIIGVLLGPIYPIVMSLCTQILPRSLHASSIGFIAALGQVGAAVFPCTFHAATSYGFTTSETTHEKN